MLPAILAFVVAAFVTWLELATSKFPRTSFLVFRFWQPYAYAAVYGLIAFGFKLGLDALVQQDLVRLKGPAIGNPWLQAVLVGLSAKALMHIRIFSVKVGTAADPFPFGVETVVQLFEPSLLRTIDLRHFNARRAYIEPRAEGKDIEKVREEIKQNIPSDIPKPEREAFSKDIDDASSVVDAMDLYLSFAGRENFDRVFPRSQS